MDPTGLILKYFPSGTRASDILLQHSRLVANKALEIASRVAVLRPDLLFIEEAAMLHDIGIVHVDAPQLGCFGSRDYLCHGYLGREMLEQEGLPRHALVCERHVGVGITAADIRQHRLLLPERDMFARSLEEKIICYADKFFSKKQDSPTIEKSLAEVRREISRYGEEKLRVFDGMTALFTANEEDSA